MKTVLLIDDDEDILSSFSLALEHHGLRVLTAESGDEGIALARQYLPDLIISDINMPGKDGLSVLQALRADPPLATRQIVLMTGNTSAVTPRTGMNLGADDFLVKPISMEELFRCVDARLARAGVNWRVEDRVVSELRATLTSTLPHELFTPLAGVLGLTAVLRSEVTNMRPQEIDEILADIQKSGERLHRTLRNYLLLLELQGASASGSSPTLMRGDAVQSAVQSRIEETLDRHQRRTDARVGIDAPALVGNPMDLVIIVEELVDNACRYSRPGTPIEVRLESDGVLTVTDRGRGMTRDQLSQIGAFQQFDRKKFEQQGLGLGLVLVQKLSARSGASLDLTSESGQGSKAKVAFQTPAKSVA